MEAKQYLVNRAAWEEFKNAELPKGNWIAPLHFPAVAIITKRGEESGVYVNLVFAYLQDFYGNLD